MSMGIRKLPHRIAIFLAFGLGMFFLLLSSEKLRLGGTAAKYLFLSGGNVHYAFAADLESNLQSSVSEFKLGNGLKVLLEEQHTLPLISIGMWYRVGSKDDPAGLEGISRLAQALTYRGSKALPGPLGLKILEEAGGHWSSYTMRDQSCFLATVRKESIADILKLEAARMSIDSFSSGDVRKEKNILQDRALALKDLPKQVLDFEVSATAFRSNPYRWPTEGVNDSVQKISSEQVWQHYTRYYVPNNANLVVVGDFETKQLLGQIERAFGGVARKNDPPQIDLHESPHLGERRVKVNRQGSIPYLEIAYPAPHILNDDFFALLIIDAILNGTEGLRFPILGQFQAPAGESWMRKGLIEKKLATQVSTQLIPTLGSYLYKVTLTLPDQFQYQAAEEAFSELIENLRTVEISEEKIRKLRAQILNAQILDQADCENRAFQLGYLESIASYKLLGELETKINQVTGQDLKRVASKYLTDEMKTVGWCVPVEKKSIIQVDRLQGANGPPLRVSNVAGINRKDTEFPSFLKPVPRGVDWTNPLQSPLTKEYSHSAASKPILSHIQRGEENCEPRENKTLSTLPRLTSWGQNFGGSATWQLVSNRLDSFQFWKPLTLEANPVPNVSPIEQAASPPIVADSANGSWPFKMERRVSANGATLIVLENRATPTVTLCAVVRAGGARDGESREGTAMFVARMLTRGTKGRNASKILEALGRLQARLEVETGYLASVVTLEGPSGNLQELLELFSDILQHSAFTQFEMESVRAELLAGLREGETENQQILNRLLREKIYPAGHPFRRPVQGTITSMERIKLTDLDSFYKKNYRPRLFSLIIAGDISRASALDMTEKLFGTWKGIGGDEDIPIPELMTAVDSSSQVQTLPEKFVCSVGFGVPGIAAKHPDFLAMSLANHVFGNGRSSRLAQRIRNEDGLTGAVESGYLGRAGEGPMAIQVTIPPVKIDPLVSAVRSEVERFQKDGISDLEFESAKKAIINAYWVRLKSNRGLAQEFAFSEVNQLGEDYVNTYPDLIAGISKDQVSECTRKYLDFDQGPKVIVGPYEKR
jgi:zinc protease